MNESTVKDTANSVKEEGDEAWSYVLDVTSPDDYRALAQRVDKTSGRLTCLTTRKTFFARRWQAKDQKAAYLGSH